MFTVLTRVYLNFAAVECFQYGHIQHLHTIATNRGSSDCAVKLVHSSAGGSHKVTAKRYHVSIKVCKSSWHLV
jgi:hypothetical protein